MLWTWGNKKKNLIVPSISWQKSELLPSGVLAWLSVERDWRYEGDAACGAVALFSFRFGRYRIPSKGFGR